MPGALARLLSAGVAVVALSCHAQYSITPDALRGLKTVAVTARLEMTGDPMRSCQVTDTALKSAAESAVQQSPLKLIEVGADAQLQFIVIVHSVMVREGLPPGCYASVGMV